LVQTVRHFFPQLNRWLDQLPDSRVQEACTYSRRFLAWWGMALYVLQLGSRRQLDFELRDGGPAVLANLNRLAETQQTTLPVYDTLDHDATGLICFHQRHCPHCLVQRRDKLTLYMHQVLEAKLLGPGGVVVSLDSEFIDNADAGDRKGKSAEQIKQDCELKALARLLPRIKKSYPQLPFVLALDSLYGCGTAFALAQQFDWSFVVTFKEGRTPALWQEYQALLKQCPENTLKRTWADREQEYRWVNQLDYQDSENRRWKLNALQCTETIKTEKQRTETTKTEKHFFAWLTPLPVNKKTVEPIAQKGGRSRWKIENEGFNRQKNSELNLEHVYSTNPEKWKIYYVLLQIAFIVVQLLERGSLLRRLAQEVGRPFWKLFGSLKNVARRLLDSVRFVEWEDEWFDPKQASRLRIELDTS
jgi:hypothetical protein